MAAILVTKKLNLSSVAGSTVPPVPAVPLPAVPAPALPPPAVLLPAAPLAPAPLLPPLPLALPLAPAVEVDPLVPELVPAMLLEPALVAPAWVCDAPAVPVWAVPPVGFPLLVTGSLPEHPQRPRPATVASATTAFFRPSKISNEPIAWHCGALATFAITCDDD